jgi:serine phosphatase RsbU (regulator of sigma subunit)
MLQSCKSRRIKLKKGGRFARRCMETGTKPQMNLVESVTELEEQLLAQYIRLREAEELKEFIKENFPKPGPVPLIRGIQIHGESIPVKSVGGDLLVNLNFPASYNLESRIARARREGKEDIAKNLEKLYTKGGIFMADVFGHDEHSALVAMRLYRYLQMGCEYELKYQGDISVDLFEYLNNLFLESPKKATLIYGEIDHSGRFRFVNMGHPDPLIYSRKYERFMKINLDNQAAFPPLGALPLEDQSNLGKELKLAERKRYRATDINLMGHGDILLLYTDGIYDGADDECRDGLEQVVSGLRDAPVDIISRAIMEYSIAYDPRRFEKDKIDPDDRTIIVIKKD